MQTIQAQGIASAKRSRGKMAPHMSEAQQGQQARKEQEAAWIQKLDGGGFHKARVRSLHVALRVIKNDWKYDLNYYLGLWLPVEWEMNCGGKD
jgi:hypothetical protein